LLTSSTAHGAGTGGASDNQGAGGEGQISTWVVGAVNGGVSKPAGAQTCTEWFFLDGSTLAGKGSPAVINPATGQEALIFVRMCDSRYQYVYVTPLAPVDLARSAYQQAAALVPRPTVDLAPPAEQMIVNFESWLGVAPQQPVSATASIPGLSATVVATPARIEWATGSRVAGDTKVVSCKLWGSTTSSDCAWTPTYPSIDRVTGTSDLRYHGSLTLVWTVSWRATNGAGGSLPELRTTTPLRMAVHEIQTIGDG
jgi:hypothetical protein